MVSMETDGDVYADLTRGEKVLDPLCLVKVSVTIDTMLNFDGELEEHNDVTCKQTLRTYNTMEQLLVQKVYFAN